MFDLSEAVDREFVSVTKTMSRVDDFCKASEARQDGSRLRPAAATHLARRLIFEAVQLFGHTGSVVMWHTWRRAAGGPARLSATLQGWARALKTAPARHFPCRTATRQMVCAAQETKQDVEKF